MGSLMKACMIWSCLSGTGVGQFKIILHVDFGMILVQMHLPSGGFSWKDCSHADFVKVILARTFGTIRLESFFNCN